MTTGKSDMNLICFDLEGPLAPQDNAYELMKLFSHGGKIFEVISRYDDLLTLEARPGYEPGDTLALITPFLAYRGIKEEQIVAMGHEAGLTPGAAELISKLKSRGWRIFCISTSYEQYASPITQRLGIPWENVACTSFPLEQICQLLSHDDFALLKQTEEEIVNLNPFIDDTRIREYLDHFYWQKLPQKKSGKLIGQVKPVGGRRKVEALENFSTKMGKPLSRWIVVGDSITDFKMLQAVNKAGGLAIAFNANEYALPYSTLGLASVSLYDLWVVLEAWEKGGRLTVEQIVKEKEKVGGTDDREHFHWLAEKKDITTPLEIHKRIRRLVREEAAKLG
jgi:energy-converting hydrogenase A subunit R